MGADYGDFDLMMTKVMMMMMTIMMMMMTKMMMNLDEDGDSVEEISA